jgi:hypothetical protein
VHAINPESLLRIRQIIGDPKAGIPAIINVSKSTWWSWSAASLVGAPVRIGGATFWRAADVLRLVDGAANDEHPGAAQPVESTIPANGNDSWKQKLRARTGAKA